MIKVVIVDDSPTARMHLRQSLEKDPELLVVAEAQTGAETLHVVQKFNPDLVTMDVYLKNENGLDITASLMSRSPRPIIVITGVNPKDPNLIYKAMDRGALEVFPKLPATGDPSYETNRKSLVRLVKSLSSVPVATRWQRGDKTTPFKTRRVIPEQKVTRVKRQRTPRALLIGASTGGPPVVGKILTSLPKPFPLPIIVVQHISAGFGAGYAEWLTQTTGLKGVLVERATTLKSNTLYVAPDSQHIVFTSPQILNTRKCTHTDTICPSIDRLFESAAQYIGSSTIGILLTGMGRDGGMGLKKLKDAGSTTIAQSPQTCAVDSMPSTAIAMDAVSAVLRPEQMTEMIMKKLGDVARQGVMLA